MEGNIRLFEFRYRDHYTELRFQKQYFINYINLSRNKMGLEIFQDVALITFLLYDKRNNFLQQNKETHIF